METPSCPVTEAMVRDKLAGLPGLPPLVSELLESFQQENLDVPALARRVAADQGLLVRMLRIANSSFYGLAGRVVSIDDAILVLGFRTVRSLVVSVAITGAFREAACPRFQPATFWRHAVATAVSAREIAKVRRRSAETAFTGGLVHDIGRYVLAVCFPDAYERTLEWREHVDCLHLDAEREVLGIDHARVGAILARAWGLPEALEQDIACHHFPADHPGADLVHLGDVLAHMLEHGGRSGGIAPEMDPAAGRRMGFDRNGLAAMLPGLEEQFEEACNALLS